MKRTPNLVSIVVPLLNEQLALPILWDRLHKVMEAMGYPYEIIFVDDGSSDSTWQAITDLQGQHSTVRGLSFTRNFGHQAALLAGLSHAQGDCVISLDGDLQHPPELIPELLQQWQNNFQIVSTIRSDSKDVSALKKKGSAWFYRFFQWLSGLPLNPGMADFRLLDRSVVDMLKHIEERALFLRGILQWSGFKQTQISYQAEDRAAGTSKYTYLKMLQLALDGITSFSLGPLRLATLLGFAFSALSFLYLIYALFIALFTDLSIPGWTSVIGSVLFLGGIQLICLGIIGEYVGKTFMEVKKRPHYLIAQQQGFGDE